MERKGIEPESVHEADQKIQEVCLQMKKLTSLPREKTKPATQATVINPMYILRFRAVAKHVEVGVRGLLKPTHDPLPRYWGQFGRVFLQETMEMLLCLMVLNPNNIGGNLFSYGNNIRKLLTQFYFIRIETLKIIIINMLHALHQDTYA
jgi:hypothetical protein